MPTTLITTILLVLAPLGTPPATPQSAPVPSCQYEDGNPDGLPCMWSDPDTGTLYYNDSRNYWAL